MTSQTIQKIPQKGMALVIDDAKILGPDQATGYFLVKGNDPRVVGHFNVMPGVLVAEFAHQTATYLVMQDNPESIPCLETSNLNMKAAALPGDALVCVLRVTARHGRKMSFSADVYKTNNNAKEHIASVEFTGTSLSKRLLDRMYRKTGEALQA